MEDDSEYSVQGVVAELYVGCVVDEDLEVIVGYECEFDEDTSGLEEDSVHGVVT